jgi:hypothetical protein
MTRDTHTIKQAVNIVNYIGKYVKLVKVGRFYKGLCPFHAERAPSFTVDPQKRRFKCYGCNANGTIFDFVMLYYNVDFKEALKRLSQEAGLHIDQPFEPRFISEPSEPSDRPQKASDEVCDAVYRDTLKHLTLTREHCLHLEQRGLPCSEIKRRGYKTLPSEPLKRQDTAWRLYRAYGEKVFSVPGVVRRKSKSGRDYVTIAGHSGILIPVRNLQGQIIAFKVRVDNREIQASGGKYFWLSSASNGGASPGNPCHVPLSLEGVQHAKDIIRVTEGELKADIATVLDPKRIWTLSVPGVNACNRALPILEELKPKKVLVAWDSDWKENPAIAKALRECIATLQNKGFAVEVETW